MEPKIIKTRKKHICFGCGNEIDPKTKVLFLRYWFYEDVKARYCPTCVKVLDTKDAKENIILNEMGFLELYNVFKSFY